MAQKNSRKVKKFWEARASDPKLHPDEVTHQDIWQRWLEIEMIKKFILPGSRVLDVGCGNGYTTKQLAASAREIIGIDFSAEMIERARKKEKDIPVAQEKRCIFSVCDVLELNADRFGLFDLVVTERCLINLPDWESQQRAILNIASVLKEGGRLIFVEGSRNGRDKLNKIRQEVGLEAMPPVWYNVDFDRKKTFSYLKKRFDIIQDLHFGIYDFISRVIHPLYISPDQPQYDSKFNEIAAKIAFNRQEFGDISRVIFLVLQKNFKSS